MIRSEHRGRVTIITMDRPERYNALDAAAQTALAGVFDVFAADDHQWIAILTGAGTRAFCAGHDLTTPPPRGPEDLPRTGFGGITARWDLDKPVIAAVNGVAVGGGFEMALACDIMVADPSARFGLPEVKVGMAALGGGILRLPRVIGLKRAMGLMLTGRLIDADEGRDLGFINEVAPEGVSALDTAMRWAELLLEASPLAIRATKAVALGCAVEPLESAMDRQWKLDAVRRMQASGDAQEGASAFNNRRPAQWQGR